MIIAIAVAPLRKDYAEAAANYSIKIANAITHGNNTTNMKRIKAWATLNQSGNGIGTFYDRHDIYAIYTRKDPTLVGLQTEIIISFPAPKKKSPTKKSNTKK